MPQAVLSFGQWVRERRKQRKLTQKSLGRLIGYAEITIRQIEHDAYHLTRFVVEGVVNCLATEADDREAIARFALSRTATGDAEGVSVGSRPSFTPFFGREVELENIRSLLHNPECRCISIVGVGGIGKTRLAVRATDAYISETAAAALFLSLANVTSAALLPSAIAEALDIAVTPFIPPFEQLLMALQSQEILLVLDNFEHLLPDGVDLVLAILERAPKIKIVITSRERLRVAGEWCVQLHGLDTSDQPSMSVAAQLFVSTAQRINDKFDASEIDAIQHICRVVQGIPLAIEMAASWTEVYSCRDILSDISAHVLGLTSRWRDVDQRHRTLEAVFETTWTLLSPAEQSTLKKLASFRGGFTLDAARRVAGITHASLAFLQDKMLIRPQNNGRLVMHEMIHEFAFQKLAADSDALLQARLSHAEYFVQLLRLSFPRMIAHHTRQEITRLIPEIENLQAAWNTILAQGRDDWFFDTWGCLNLFYNVTSRFQDAVEIFRLASLEFTSADQETERYVRAFSQVQQAAFLFRQGRIPEAASLQFAPEAQRVRDNRNFYGRWWVNITDACLHYGMGNASAALSSAQLALKIAGDDPYYSAQTYFLLGRAALLVNDNMTAHQYLSESLRLCRVYGFGWAISLVLGDLGSAAEAENKLTDALSYFESALADAASFEDLWSYHHAHISIGRLQLALGHIDKAADIQITALRAMLRNPVIGLEIDNFVEIGQILIKYGEPRLAAALLEVCASHPECFQPTRDRAMQYLTALKTGLPDLNESAVRYLLPAAKSEIAALLLNTLTAGRGT